MSLAQSTSELLDRLGGFGNVSISAVVFNDVGHIVFILAYSN